MYAYHGARRTGCFGAAHVTISLVVCCRLTHDHPTHGMAGMNQSFILVAILLLWAAEPSSGSSDKYEKACPAGSRCYGMKGNYSAMGYRGCIRTFDCDVQVNMVPQKKKLSGGFDFSYFVCLRKPNSTLTMYFTHDFNNTNGTEMIHAKIRVTEHEKRFGSFVRIGNQSVEISDPPIEKANMSSGFHLSNKHLIKVKAFTKDASDGSRGMSDHEKGGGEVHGAEGIPILNCQSMVMFFSQDILFYTDETSQKNISELHFHRSKNLYLKLRLEWASGNGIEIETVSITLSEPGSGRAGIIFIICITVLVFLACTKCFNCFSCCRSCCSRKEAADVEAQADNGIEV